MARADVCETGEDRELLKGFTDVPRVIITDQLRNYGAAKREILPSVEHQQHRYLDNRAEHSHQRTRQPERRMGRFKSPGHAQRFLAAYGPITQHFRPPRHQLSAPVYRQEMGQRFRHVHPSVPFHRNAVYRDGHRAHSPPDCGPGCLRPASILHLPAVWPWSHCHDLGYEDQELVRIGWSEALSAADTRCD